MAKKLTLDVTSMQEDFFEGTYLMGLVCSFSPTSIIWHINDKLNTTFYRDQSLDIKMIKQRSKNVILFPVFQMQDALKGNRHVLYQLKAGRDRLLPELQNMDYLWMIQGATADQEIMLYADAVAKISGIQMVQQIPVEKIEHSENLLV